MVDVVSGRTQPEGRLPVHRPLSVPRGTDAELLRQRSGQALLLLRLRRRRRPDQVRPRDRAAGLLPGGGMARRALPGAARVRGDVAPTRASRKRRDRLHEVLDQPPRSTSVISGRRRRGHPCGSTSSHAGSARRCAASSGSGSPPAPASRRRRSRRVSRGTSFAALLHERSGQRLLPSPADVPTGRCAGPDRRLPGA